MKLRPVLATVAALALSCGSSHLPPSSQFAQICSSQDPQKSWVRSYMDEVYLWYSQIPNVDRNAYPTAPAYFEALKVTTPTPSGHPTDRFSFTYDTAAWNALAGSGAEVGYGIAWSVVPNTRIIQVAYIEPNTPAAASTGGIARGATVKKVNGLDVTTMDRQTLIDALWPPSAGTVSFELLENGATTTHVVSLTSTTVTHQPVLVTNVLTTASGKIGYMLFNSHLGAAEPELIQAIGAFQSAGITDLVLDLRYNGGGYLSIAAELGYMLGGAKVQGKVFEREQFNDKLAQVTSSSAYTEPFLTTASTGSGLPTLNLSRVFVLTSSSTCSASEAVMNGLAPFIPVVRIGTTTCGKPYGFYPQDNCGTTYFPIEFRGVNAAGQGDYADGMSPECTASDDLTHALGDPAEGQLAAALSRLANGVCPPVAVGPRVADGAALQEPVLLRTPAHEARIVTPR